jgi:hypothetical protein
LELAQFNQDSRMHKSKSELEKHITSIAAIEESKWKMEE